MKDNSIIGEIIMLFRILCPLRLVPSESDLNIYELRFQGFRLKGSEQRWKRKY